MLQDLVNSILSIFDPLNLSIGVVLGTIMYILLKKPKVDLIVEVKQAIVPRDFTPRELATYNGLNSQPIYISIMGEVFDVSTKPDFYGPGSMYENFSGRDASRGMAKHSFELDMLTDLSKEVDRLLDLDEDERQALGEWLAFFRGKYPVIGRLINP